MNIFLDICDRIGFPVSQEKTVLPVNVLTFLGLLIDTIRQMVSIPMDKIAKCLNMITSILDKSKKKKSKRKMTILQFQQISGFLNILGRAVVPGWAFTRRLYAKLAEYSHLKQHHHFRISEDIFCDLAMWCEFLMQPAAYSIGSSWTSAGSTMLKKSNFLWMHLKILN